MLKSLVLIVGSALFGIAGGVSWSVYENNQTETLAQKENSKAMVDAYIADKAGTLILMESALARCNVEAGAKRFPRFLSELQLEIIEIGILAAIKKREGMDRNAAIKWARQRSAAYLGDKIPQIERQLDRYSEDEVDELVLQTRKIAAGGGQETISCLTAKVAASRKTEKAVLAQ